MYKLLFPVLLLSAPQAAVSITSTVSGVAAADLADTPLTNSLNMEAGQITNQLSLTLAVTPGTSLIVDVRCYESQDGTNWGQISHCDSLATSTCVPDLRRYTLANYATVSGVKYIPTRWAITKKYTRCSVDDPADGDGTVTITGARRWQ
jgi:hypothetical protein